MQGTTHEPATLLWNAKRAVDLEASLWNAIAHGDNASARLLLARGANPNGGQGSASHRQAATPELHRRADHPLLLAAGLGRAQIMRDLLAAGSNAKARSDDGSSLILRSAQSRSLECLRIACQACPELAAESNRSDGDTPLMACARWGSLIALELALCLPHELGRANAKGESALHLATSQANPKAVARLLELGAHPDPRDARGVSPLMIASDHAHLELMDALASHGADIDAMDGNGRTIPMRLCRKAKREGLLKILALGANLRLTRGGQPDGCTAAGFAICEGWPFHLRDLVQAGADPEAVQAGTTPYAMALKCKNWACMGEFISDLRSFGADIDRRDSLGLFALSRCRDPRIARALLQAGADPNAETAPGFSFLERSCVQNGKPRADYGIAMLLLEHGACVAQSLADLFRDRSWSDGSAGGGFEYVPILLARELMQREAQELASCMLSPSECSPPLRI